MGLLESFKNILPGDKAILSPEQERINELEKERVTLNKSNESRPESWGVDPRYEQINKEIENLTRDLQHKEK